MGGSKYLVSKNANLADLHSSPPEAMRSLSRYKMANAFCFHDGIKFLERIGECMYFDVIDLNEELLRSDPRRYGPLSLG